MAGTAACALSAPAAAQADPETPSWAADEIIVTGERRARYDAKEAAVARTPVPLVDIPQSIQVITATLIEEQELNTLTEALRNVSGVTPNGVAETVLANPIIRGFEAEIYVDGLIGYGDTAVIDPSSLVGVERIEVAKGPTSVLFGGGTGAPVGGLINVVTKTPQAEAFARIGVRAGSFSTVAPNVDVNMPLGERAGFRVAAEYHASDDYIDDVEIERITVNPSFGLELTEDTDFLLRAGYNRIEQLEYAGLPAQVANLPGVDRFQFGGAPDAPETVIENLSIHGTLTHAFTDRIKGSLQVRRFENSFDEFSTTPVLSVFAVEGTSATLINGQLPVDTNQWTIDASATAEFSTGVVDHVLLAGVTYDDTNYQAASGFGLFTPIGDYDYLTQTPRLSFGEAPPLVTFLESDYETVAGYLQNQVSIGERVNLLIGGRYSRYALTEVEGGQGTDETFTRFDPRVGASIEVANGVSLFAGWSTGSRLSLFFAGEDGAPPKLETSQSLEGGVKFAVERIGLSGTLAGYRIIRENVPTPDPTTFVTSIQTGEQRSVGAEVDLIWEPTRSLSILLSAAYADAEITDDTELPAGTRLPRVPETSGRLAARYRFDEAVFGGALNGLGVGAGLSWSQEAALAFPNPEDPRFPDVFDSDAFLVADAQASYAFDRFRIGVTVQNLFDEEYFIPYQYFSQEVVRPSQPRSAFVTLSATF